MVIPDKHSKTTDQLVKNKLEINPFKYYHRFHYYLGYELIDGHNIKILDYGCGRGRFISSLRKISKQLYGFDIDPDTVNLAKKRYPWVKFFQKKGNRLPFKAGSFDAVIFFHTLEHVDSEESAINEIVRVLKKGGTLYLASPYKGLLSWLDVANLRYRFPKFHKLLFEILIGKKEYEHNFVNKKNNQLFGDCSINRNWHRHYKESEIRKMLSKKFVINRFYKYSLFCYLLLIPYNIYKIVFGKESKFFNFIIWLDANIHAGDFSSNFFLIATKNK